MKKKLTDPKISKPSNAEKTPPKSLYEICGKNYEAVVYQGKPAFLKYVNEQTEIHSRLVSGSLEVRPKVPQISHFEFSDLPQLLTKQELFDQVYSVFDSYVDARDEYTYLATCIVLLSYQQNKVNVVPYLEIFGASETGKSDFLSIIASLGYYGLFSADLPSADIYGYLDEIKPAIGLICEDESQGLERDTQRLKIWKTGYHRGAKILRTDMQPQRKLRYYDCFCLKCMGGEARVKDEALRSRTIPLRMLPGKPRKSYKLEPPLAKDIQDLKAALLTWKLSTANEELPMVDSELTGRSREIWLPIFQIASSLEQYDELVAFAKENLSEKVSENRAELRSRIISVVSELVNKRFTELGLNLNVTTVSVTFADIWKALRDELAGIGQPFEQSLDENFYTTETSDYGTLSKESVGHLIYARFKCSKHVQRVEGKSQQVYIFER